MKDNILIKTPIIKIDEINNNLYIKREDLLPFSFGGNKVRIAYEYVQDMKKNNCNLLIGYGNPRSNLCRALTNMAKIENINCWIVSPSEDNGERCFSYNEKLSSICDGKIIPCDKNHVQSTIKNVIREAKEQNYKPYYIYGNIYGTGNKNIPVKAYDLVFKEILYQEKQIGINFDYIFLAVGTGMTQSGLISSNMTQSVKKNIVGISIARQSNDVKNWIKDYVLSYTNKKIQNNDINVIDDYVLGGYGKYNNELFDYVKNFYIKFGIPLDLTYTGKAMFGMSGYLRENKITGKNILFIHTGGTPLFFDMLSSV